MMLLLSMRPLLFGTLRISDGGIITPFAYYVNRFLENFLKTFSEATAKALRFLRSAF